MRDKDWGGDWVTGEFKTASLTGSNFAGMVDGIEGESEESLGMDVGGAQVTIVRESSGPAASRNCYRPSSSPLTAGRKRRRRGPEMGREHVSNPPPTASFGKTWLVHTLPSRENRKDDTAG